MRIAGHIVASAAAPPLDGVLTCDGGRIGAIDPAPVPRDAGWLVPGLIDSHTHPLEAGLELLFADLRGAASVAEVLGRLGERRDVARDRGTMLGFNLDPDALAEQRYPSVSELDAAAGSIPTLVYRVDCHSAALNSTGLELLGRLATAGFEVGPDGRRTGVVRGPAYEAASRLFKARLRPEDVGEALARAGEAAVRAGITGLGAFVGNDDLAARDWEALLDGLARMACSATPFLQTWDPGIPARYGLRQAGGCLLIDGSFGSRTAALTEDYADAPGNRGMCYETDDKVAGFIRRCEELSLQAAFHAIGDRAVEQVVRCHERLASGRVRALRHRIEHAELLGPGLVRRIAALGLVLGVQPAFEAEWGGPDRMYARRLGGRWRGTNPFRSLAAAGVRFAGGSDAPITPLGPLAGIKAALNHPNPAERLTADQALALFTSEAAFALQAEDRAGVLRPDMAADITVLTSDPRAGGDCRVAATVRAGRIAYRHAELGSRLLTA